MIDETQTKNEQATSRYDALALVLSILSVMISAFCSVKLPDKFSGYLFIFTAAVLIVTFFLVSKNMEKLAAGLAFLCLLLTLLLCGGVLIKEGSIPPTDPPVTTDTKITDTVPHTPSDDDPQERPESEQEEFPDDSNTDKDSEEAPAETEHTKVPREYTVSWEHDKCYETTVERTASPYANAPTEILNSGAKIYEGDELRITYTANTGYTISDKGSTFITVSGNITSSKIYATVTVNSYTVSWNSETGYTVDVTRTASPYQDATDGTLNNGDTIFYGDKLSVTYSPLDGYRITDQGSTSITVTGNVTFEQIYAVATETEYSYQVVYQSTNGTELGTDTVTYTHGTTNTIIPPAKAGYDTPAPQSVTWDSVEPKTILFVYTPSAVATTQHLTSGWWYSAPVPNTGVSYSVDAKYQNRTANSVQVQIVWTQTIKAAAYGYNQYFYCSIWNNSANIKNTGAVRIASTQTWPYYSANGPWHTDSKGVSSEWITIPLDSTAPQVVEIACDWWTEVSSESGSWSGKQISIPAY